MKVDLCMIFTTWLLIFTSSVMELFPIINSTAWSSRAQDPREQGCEGLLHKREGAWRKLWQVEVRLCSS